MANATSVPDGLWERIEPLLPRRKPHPKGGRPYVDDRRCLAGILFVLQSGIAWSMLPREFGVSPMSCWRRLRDWQRAGVWRRLHERLLAELNAAGRLTPQVAVADSTSLRAVKGATRPDRTRPTAARAAASSTCSRTPRARR